MKFLFWTDGFWPRIGGIETQAMHFVEGMKQKGHSSLVVAQKDEPNWKEDECYQDIPIKRFDFNRIFPARQLKNLAPIEVYLQWVVKEFKPDIVHLNACVGWHGFIFLLFRKLFTVPLVATIHAPFFYQNEGNPLLEKIALQADRICCVSKWVLNETKKLIPDSQSKLRLIYNGLPVPSLPLQPLCFSPPTLLIMGRFTAEKGYETAILAFSLLKNAAAKLLIVGSGEERASMERLVSRLGLQSSVDFTGPVRKEDVPNLINQACLVIVPSYFESFGLVALEAMQMGRPVIASSVGGLQEIVSHGETGLLVPPCDPAALSAAIEFLLDRTDMATDMGIEGRKRAIKTFTLHQNLEQYEAVYSELGEKRV